MQGFFEHLNKILDTMMLWNPKPAVKILLPD